MAKIFVNPGHEVGKDPGAIGRSGLTEAFVVADIGRKLKDYLQFHGHSVYLLQSDYLTGLVNEANEWGADVFVSIHCNGFASEQAHGTETLYYPGSKQGRLLADCLQKRMLESFAMADRGIKERANLYVLGATQMPSALAETAFITNPADEQLLATEAKRMSWARALGKGIIDYVKTNKYF